MPDPLIPLGLAQGPLEPRDQAELLDLKAQIQREARFSCESYKDKCLRRRVAVRMRARGVHRFGDYAELLRREPAEYERLLATLTINVSKFFRNPDVWALIGERLLPELAGREDARIRTWCAGAAAGEEPYTLAILIRELERRSRGSELASRFDVLATDVDRGALAAGREAVYPDAAVAEVPARLLRRWFEPGPPWQPRRPVRELVRFEEADILAAEPPSGLHLLICRNVFIYFERAAQERMFARFRDALAPDGYLVLGRVETIVGPASASFEVVSARERIYRLR